MMLQANMLEDLPDPFLVSVGPPQAQCRPADPLNFVLKKQKC